MIEQFTMTPMVLLQCCLKGCLKILLHGVFSALGAVVREIFMGQTWVYKYDKYANM